MDVSAWNGYDRGMTPARAAKPQLSSEDAERERERIVAKVERSLASLDAGKGIPHDEVLAMIDARYPGSKG